MLRNVLARFQSAILEHPVSVLVLSGTLLVLAVVLGLGVELRTSRSELAPEGEEGIIEPACKFFRPV